MNTQIKTGNRRKTVAVAVSSGIDSAYTALLLKENGFDVFPVTMKIFDNDTFDKISQKVKKIAATLRMESTIIDLQKEFRELIIEKFCKTYLEGKTPNPCVECNRYVKFGLLMEKARQLGADFFATGHYARLTINGATGEHEIKKGIDPTKDQSYVLWKLHGSRLRSILMPMGSKFKTDAKKEAYETFPYLHDSGESQDICFLGKTSYRSFISERPENSISFGEIISKEAKVVNSRGQVLGHHKGFPFYTIGQRKGFGVSHAKPLYVIKIISENNTIVVGEEEELYRTEFDLEEVNFINNKPPGDKFTCNVKIRYNSPEAPAKVEMTDVSSARIRMADPQKAVTPGQSAVFYIRDTLTGGGIIK